MGWASEQMIAEHNARMESDAEYAAEYEASEHEAAEAEAHYEFWLNESIWLCDREKSVDWFDDFRIDHTGYIEVIPPFDFEPSELSDEDIPF